MTMIPKSMNSVSEADAAFRSQAEAKARKLEPMTEAEIACLSTESLGELYGRAKLARMRIECRDDCLTGSHYAALKIYRAIEGAASAELEARKEQAA